MNTYGFPPIAGSGARVLVLGTAPSIASLKATQYYGHPRNAFWPIMGELFNAGPDRPYAERGQRLCARGIAVWDVLASCERKGSLDSAIIPDSVIANDFAGFFKTHPGIEHILHNGGPSFRLFNRYVIPEQQLPTVERLQLPSTSPANASWSFERKLAAWRTALDQAGLLA